MAKFAVTFASLGLSAMAFAQASAGAPPSPVNLDFQQGNTGWTLRPGYSVREGVGMNGTAALVYDNADPKLPYRLCSQPLKLKAGEQYRYSAWVRTEGLKPGSGVGAQICIEWTDGKGHLLGGSYSKGIRGTTAWTKLEGVTTVIPADATSFSLVPFCSPGSTGKVYFDDMEVAPYRRAAVGHLVSSSYRDTAASGVVDFKVWLCLPERYQPSDVKGAFAYTAADGSRRTIDVALASRDVAECSVEASALREGTSEVSFQLTAPDGKVLGESKLAFHRVAKLPNRRVWFDEHRRTIVDGKPFFPLGLFSGHEKRRETYVRGPFNCIMLYEAPDAVSMDYFWTNGVRVIYSVKDVYVGMREAPKAAVNEAAADAYVAAKVETLRTHPGLLAWYVNDEQVGDRWFKTLEARQEQLSRLDPDHPTWAVIYQLEFLRDITRTFDVIGTDPYPVPGHPLSMVTDWSRQTDRAYFGFRPMWQVPQVFDWGVYRPRFSSASKPDRMPTVREMQSMAWQCVAAGANGLIAYGFTAIQYASRKDGKAAMPFDIAWKDICTAYEQVKRYIPVLLSVEPTPSVSGAPAAWGVRLWRKDGATWLLAVNAQDKAETAELVLSEDFSSVAAEFGTAAAKSAARTLKVTLAPNEPALYRIR